MRGKNIMLFCVFCLLATALQGCRGEKPVEHAVFSGEFFSVAVPAGYLPITENKDYISKALVRVGAPKEAIGLMLTAPAGAYFNPGTMSMANYSGRKVEKTCGEILGMLKAVGGAGEKLKIGPAEWLLLAREKDRVLEYHSCSGSLVVSAVYADPAGTIKDLRGFASANLAGMRLR